MPSHRFLMNMCCENCMSGFSTFFFDFSKSGNILLRSLPNENFLFSSASLSLVDNNSLLHKLRVMAAVDPHGNATYDAQHPAKKSIYAKRNSVMLEKSYKTVFQIARVFEIPKRGT